ECRRVRPAPRGCIPRLDLERTVRVPVPPPRGHRSDERVLCPAAECRGCRSAPPSWLQDPPRDPGTESAAADRGGGVRVRRTPGRAEQSIPAGGAALSPPSVGSPPQ